jgi:hypothetical protein
MECGMYGEKINAYGVFVENLKETDHPEDHGVHERIML